MPYLVDEAAIARRRAFEEKKETTQREKRNRRFAAQVRQAKARGVKVQRIPRGKKAEDMPQPPRGDQIALLNEKIKDLLKINDRLQWELAHDLRPAKHDFYDSPEWQRIRYEALKRSDGKCECCGASKQTGAVIQVDHIKPRSKFPALSLELTNLQVLCKDCNLGKGAKDSTDWR